MAKSRVNVTLVEFENVDEPMCHLTPRYTSSNAKEQG